MQKIGTKMFIKVLHFCRKILKYIGEKKKETIILSHNIEVINEQMKDKYKPK